MTTMRYPKKVYALIVIGMFFSIMMLGQDHDQNYVQSTVYKVETTTEDVLDTDKIENISYLDGLARAKQTIAVDAGGDQQHIMTYIEYDDFGRSLKQYLQYPSMENNPLEFMDQAILKGNIEDFYDTPKYQNTQNPYSEVRYEESPLNRMLEQAAPGNTWALDPSGDGDRTIKFEYRTNGVNEVYNFDVIFFEGNVSNPQLYFDSFYGENELLLNVIKNENWETVNGNNATTWEFTNKEGQIVLKRAYDNNIAHDTYFIYDDFGNLTYVLSPEASSQIIANGDLTDNHQEEVIDKFGYQYIYDYRRRLIEKRIPGKGSEYIVYNRLDQPILTQDALMREDNEWLATKYDVFGRVVYTGIIVSSDSRQLQQNMADNITLYPSVYEHRIFSSPTIVGDTHLYYSNTSFPANISRVHTIYYYDTYVDHDGINLPNTIYGQTVSEETKGLTTVVRTRVLNPLANPGEVDWITTVVCYDEKDRSIYTFEHNAYLGSSMTAEKLLNFTGNVLEDRMAHIKGVNPAIVTHNYYNYDHLNRLLSHKQQINNEPLQLIAENTYDEIGQLLSKNVGGETIFDGYVDIIDIDVSAEGVITNTNTNNDWGPSLKTKGEVRGDGGVRFTALNTGVYYKVGLLSTTSASTNPQYFDYGIYISAADSNSDGQKDVRVILHSTSPTAVLTGYNANDVFRVERIGQQIHFKKNGSTFHSVTMSEADNSSFVAQVGLYSHNAQLNDLTLFGDHVNKKLQKIDYQYNVRGWLTDINDTSVDLVAGWTNNIDNDLFAFKINYDQPIEGSSSLPGDVKPLYSGNISQTVWRSANTDTQKRGYAYRYDALNRIDGAYSRKGNDLTITDAYWIGTIDYDKNGNLLTLSRDGLAAPNDPEQMDQLQYQYDGNQLLSVTDILSASEALKNEGFYDGNTSSDDYGYDVNGNMVEDKNKGITAITYNHLNLPVTISVNGVDGQDNVHNGTIVYIYDAQGNKMEKRVTDNGGATSSVSYANGYIYEKANASATEQLKMFPHPEGYVEPEYNSFKTKFDKNKSTVSFAGFRYSFQYKDHLNNVRLTYSDIDRNGHIKPSAEIISEKSYYPFGLQQKGYNNTVSGNANSMAERFAYNGKENNPELGLEWMDFGARNYNSDIARWANIDNYSEDFYVVSPYNYSLNNPIFFVDPDGNTVVPAFKDPKNKQLYDNLVSRLKTNSLFAEIYSSLDSDYDNFIVSEFTPDDVEKYPNVKAFFKPALIETFFTKDNNRIAFRNDGVANAFNQSGVAEEFFHAFQDQNPKTRKLSLVEKETEAKIFVSFLVYQGLSKEERRDLDAIDRALGQFGTSGVTRTRGLIYGGKYGTELNIKVLKYFDAILNGEEITEKLEEDFRASVENFSSQLHLRQYNGFRASLRNDEDLGGGTTPTFDNLINNFLNGGD